MLQGRFCSKGWWLLNDGAVVACGLEVNRRSFNKPPKELRDSYIHYLEKVGLAHEGGIFPDSDENMPQVQEEE